MNERKADGRKIEITGNASITVKLDMMKIRLRVKSQGNTKDDAYETTAARYRAIEEELIGIGIDKGDISMTGLTFHSSPVRSYDNGFRESALEYSCTQEMEIILELDKAFLAKITRIHSQHKGLGDLTISFGISDVKKAEKELCRAVVSDAKQKAELICEETGATLGKLLDARYCSESIKKWPRDLSEAEIKERILYGDDACYYGAHESSDADERFITADIATGSESVLVWEII